MGMDGRAVAHGGIFAHEGECADVDVFAHLGCRVDECQRMDARLPWFAHLVQGQELGHALIGIGHFDEGGADGLLGREIVVYQYDA